MENVQVGRRDQGGKTVKKVGIVGQLLAIGLAAFALAYCRFNGAGSKQEGEE